MLMLKILSLLITGAATTWGAPLSSVRVKFASPPHFYEHELKTDGGSTVLQRSFLSIGRRNYAFGDRLPNSPRTSNLFPPQQQKSTRPINAFSNNDVSHQEPVHKTPDFSNGLNYPDPLLLTGDAARIAVNYLYNRGELFFHEIPHKRSLLRNQQERRSNGLHAHILRSIRRNSPFFDWTA